MVIETLKDLHVIVSEGLTNHEWISLIAEGFHVSNSTAKKMLHAMYQIKKLDTERKKWRNNNV